MMQASAGWREAGARAGLADEFSVLGPIEALAQPAVAGGRRLGLELPIYGTIPPREGAAAALLGAVGPRAPGPSFCGAGAIPRRPLWVCWPVEAIHYR